ncbi:MAG: DUF99 family protein [Haloferacaceae archaeon]
MKSGVRALGVAESYQGATAGPAPDPESVLAGAVVRADRVLDGLAFETCTVGGSDATDAVLALARDLGREDVRYLLLSGIAPAWFNLLDLRRLHAELDVPVLSVSYGGSPGLADALRAEFADEALETRLETYRDQPPRRELAVGDDRVFVREVGIEADAADAVVRGFTPAGSGRPEPLRVARLAARAGRRFRE